MIIKALVLGLAVMVGSGAKPYNNIRTVVITNTIGHKSYRLDGEYNQNYVCFINSSGSNVIIRLNGSMFYIISSGHTVTFWKNGSLWVMGFSK